MTDRPILFSGPMVRALLDGRKTQTRRVLVGVPASAEYVTKRDGAWVAGRSDSALVHVVPVRFAVGDRLYVRESGWERPKRTDAMLRAGADTWAPFYYDADGLSEQDRDDNKAWGFKRRPGIHMPRWASRLTLHVTDVRVQRLREISPADAIAEGIRPAANSLTINNDTPSPVEGYRSLWNSLNAKRGFGWDTNPWVVAVSFSVEKINIDRARAA